LKDNQADIATLKLWIREVWEAVPHELIDRLILSMPRRLQALRKAKRWYTKYQSSESWLLNECIF
jgi:hypothetical protein